MKSNLALLGLLVILANQGECVAGAPTDETTADATPAAASTTSTAPAPTTSSAQTTKATEATAVTTAAATTSTSPAPTPTGSSAPTTNATEATAVTTAAATTSTAPAPTPTGSSAPPTKATEATADTPAAATTSTAPAPTPTGSSALTTKTTEAPATSTETKTETATTKATTAEASETITKATVDASQVSQEATSATAKITAPVLPVPSRKDTRVTRKTDLNDKKSPKKSDSDEEIPSKSINPGPKVISESTIILRSSRLRSRPLFIGDWDLQDTQAALFYLRASQHHPVHGAILKLRGGMKQTLLAAYIGVGGNNKTRVQYHGKTLSFNTPNIIGVGEFTKIWVSWDQGYFKMGYSVLGERQIVKVFVPGMMGHCVYSLELMTMQNRDFYVMAQAYKSGATFPCIRLRKRELGQK